MIIVALTPSQLIISIVFLLWCEILTKHAHALSGGVGAPPPRLYWRRTRGSAVAPRQCVHPDSTGRHGEWRAAAATASAHAPPPMPLRRGRAVAGAAAVDPLNACLDANGTYVCTAYNPRCYIIQKVSGLHLLLPSCPYGAGKHNYVAIIATKHKLPSKYRNNKSFHQR